MPDVVALPPFPAARPRALVQLLMAGCAGVLSVLAVPCRAGAQAGEAPVVARWNGYALAADDFADAYRRYATAVPGRDTPRRRADFARDLLERRIVAARAEQAGGAPAWVAAAARRAHDRALRAAFFEATIGPSIPPPTTAQLQEAFRRTRTHVLLRQAFTPDSAEARRWRDAVAAGAPFDSLARLGAARYGGPTADPGGRLGWITWNSLGVAPESLAFALDWGEVGGPVASENGWHLFRADSIRATGSVASTAFENMREELAWAWRQRRFDEAAARYLRRRLAAIPLRIDARALAGVWPLVAPFAPREDDPRVALEMEREVPGLASGALLPQTPLAWVAGQPFTLADFLDGLPGVEAEAWRPDLRAALETTIRDRLVTGWAREAGLDTLADARLAARRAYLAARYDDALAAAADTLTLGRFARDGYARLRDTYFAESRVARVRLWAFADSAGARDAVEAWRRGVPWPRAAARADTLVRRLTAEQAGALPLGAMQVSPGGRGAVVAGPVAFEGRWVAAELLGWDVAYTPFEAAAGRLTLLLESLRLAFAHAALLPPDYRREGVEVFPDRLAAALPFY